jgi:hypothetical protein
MIAREVLALIEGTPSITLPGIPANGINCQGSRFHSPRPMLLHRVELPHNPGQPIYLCGTCADNYHLLHALEQPRKVPWPVRRCFGNMIRALVPPNTQEHDRA